MPPNPAGPDTVPSWSPTCWTHVAGRLLRKRGWRSHIDRDGAAACLDELRTADCGEPLRDALIGRTPSRSLRPRAEKSSDAF